jgi:hemerythrin
MLSLETMSFLKHWLTRHILVADRRYGLHLNAKGVH